MNRFRASKQQRRDQEVRALRRLLSQLEGNPHADPHLVDTVQLGLGISVLVALHEIEERLGELGDVIERYGAER